MGKATQRRIDFVFKRKRDETSENEDPLAAANDFFFICFNWNSSNRTMKEGFGTSEPITFREIEYLQRDPGLRPQIWQYPPEQRDSVRRAYLMLGPMQPHLQKYKLSGEQRASTPLPI
jgi:hypothetical protein